MKHLCIGACALTLLSTQNAGAQNVFYWPAAKAPDAAGRTFEVPMGTPITLMVRTLVSSKENKVGDPVYFDVAEGVTFRGQVVIPAGSRAVGEVSRIQRNGHLGRKGKLTVRLDHVQTPHGPIRLWGKGYDEGKSGTAASLGAMAFVSVLGFLIHGTSARIEPDTMVQASLAEPLRFYWTPQQPVSASMPGDEALANHAPDRFDPSAFSGNRTLIEQ